MMNRILKLGILILLLGWITSCTRETSYEGPVPGSGDTTTHGNFTAVINNQPWAAVNNTEDGSIYMNLYMTVTGTSSDNKQIRIILNGTAVGQYVLDQHSASYIRYVDGNSGNTTPFTTYDGSDTSFAGGVVNITSIDTALKTISGNFHCKVFRNMDSQQEIITQGIFTKISYLIVLPLAALGDTLQSNVNGYSWFAPSIGVSFPANQIIVVGVERDASKGVSLFMPLNITAGTFKTDYSSGVIYGEYKPNASTAPLISDTSGTITIIENNALSRRLRGNFQFIARDLTGVTTDSAVLTQGYFSVGY
jgi:hypothetical protein